MTWTWAQIISDALMESGVLGLGQVANADYAVDGNKQLKLLLDELDGEGLALPAFDSAIQFNTVANQASYLLGPGGDANIRPETIVTATCTIQTSPVVKNQLIEIPYSEYTLIPVPSTSGQPWNYAINQTWPQMEIYLFPAPVAIYPITLNCKVKWIDTVGDPSLNPFDVAYVPSGYVNAIVYLLAYRLAKKYRIEKPSLATDAANARFMLTMMVYAQNRQPTSTIPIGVFPWQFGISGRNPWP